MRVITGRAKGHRLKAPKGLSTRPMLDRVKEALFSVLEGYGRIRGQVLDLYAGTGSIGIEFLSRGAQGADFVEQSAHVCSIIKANLVHTHLVEYGHIYTMPVERFLLSRRGRGCYDYIMMDPPYADPAIEQILCLVAAAGVGREGGLVIVGHSPRVTLAESYPGLERIKFRRLGDSCFSIYELAGTFEIPPEPSVEATAFLPDLSGL